METFIDRIKNTRLYLGPMSKNIVDAIISYVNHQNITLGLIASRRQVDYNSGYVNNWTTRTFCKYVRNKTKNLILCRDHGGIAQGKTYDIGLESLATDAICMDIIHIDPWKVLNVKEAVDYTILAMQQCNKVKNDCYFEIGTEEAIRKMSIYDLHYLLETIKLEIPELFNRIVYLVIQSGTAIQAGKNIGKYDETKLLQMIDLCNQYNILSKEHNGDYLSSRQIKHKLKIGLSAINIAPELAHLETSILLKHLTNSKINQWFNLCIQDGQWKKWFQEDFKPENDKHEVLKLCGHYVLSNENFSNIFDLQTISSQVTDEIYNYIGVILNGQTS